MFFYHRPDFPIEVLVLLRTVKRYPEKYSPFWKVKTEVGKDLQLQITCVTMKIRSEKING